MIRCEDLENIMDIALKNRTNKDVQKSQALSKNFIETYNQGDSNLDPRSIDEDYTKKDINQIIHNAINLTKKKFEVNFTANNYAQWLLKNSNEYLMES